VQLTVLGMHRSGTSVLARMLNLMGAYFGPEGISTGANDENPHGFWERRDVRALNDAALHEAGADWNRVSGFRVEDIPAQARARFHEQASKLLLELDAHRPWVLKEPRLCLLFPLWRPLLECPVVLHILRSPVEVASSLQTRNAIPVAAGLELWERYVRSAVTAAEGLPGVVVSHHDLATQPMAAVERLYRQLVELDVRGLRMPAEREVAAFVAPELYRHRETRDDLRPYLQSRQMKLFEQLLAGGPMVLGAEEGSTRELAEYEARLPPVVPKPAAKAPAPDAALRSQLEAIQQEAASLRSQLKLRDAELEQGKGRIRQLEEMIAGMRQEQGERDVTIASLRTALKDGEASIAALMAATKEREDELLRLQRESQERGELAAAREALLQARASELQARTSELEARDSRIAALEHESAAQREECARLSGKVAAHASALKQEEAKSARFSAEAAEQRRGREEAEASVGERFAELAKLTTLLLERESSLEAAHAEAARNAGELAARTAELEQVRQALSDIRNSRAWKLAAPARAVARVLRPKPAALGHGSDARLVEESGLFDAAWYLDTYTDVAAAGMDPLDHFLRFGAAEGRRPGPRFDPATYLRLNPDVARAGLDPLFHYLRHGRGEGRATG